VVLESACLNATELSGYFRERGLFPEQVELWRQTAQVAHRLSEEEPKRILLTCNQPEYASLPPG